MSIQLRIITSVIPDLKDFVSFLYSKTTLRLIVREVGKKCETEHLHCVFNLVKTRSTFRQHLKEKYPHLDGNVHYSTKLLDDPPAMIRYCCKGLPDKLPDVLYCANDINVNHEYDQFWIVNKTLKKTSEAVTSPVKKVKSPTWSERVFADILSEYPQQVDTIRVHQMIFKPSDEEIAFYVNAKRDIFRYMMKCLGKGCKKLNENIIRDIFHGILNSIMQEDIEVGNAYSDKLFKALNL